LKDASQQSHFQNGRVSGMREYVLVPLIAVVIFLSVVPVALGADYTFIPIVVPDATLTAAFDIKNSGQIIGEYGCCVGPLGNDAFLLSRGTFTTIPDFPGADATNATGINGRGDIVGTYLKDGTQHGFLLSRKGVFRKGVFSTVDFPDAALTQLWGINNKGQIIGETGESSFLFSDGVFTSIDVPGASGGIGTAARGINNAGKIVGSYQTGASVHGFLLSHGTFTTIDFPGAVSTYLFGINKRGDIVGSYQLVPSGDIHGFLLSRGNFQAIDAPGFSNTLLFGLNDVGDIVGEVFDLSELTAEGILVTRHPARFQ
jgi:uncharacterized membrane protein